MRTNKQNTPFLSRDYVRRRGHGWHGKRFHGVRKNELRLSPAPADALPPARHAFLLVETERGFNVYEQSTARFCVLINFFALAIKELRHLQPLILLSPLPRPLPLPKRIN
jgi:hypothetical protein